MEVKFIYDDENHILIKQYNGIISIEDIIQTWIGAFMNGYFDKPIIGIINDYRNAVFDFTLKESNRIPEFLQQNLEYFGGKKIAVIADTPASIIYPIMIKNKDKGYVSQAFTTYEGAMQWILMP